MIKAEIVIDRRTVERNINKSKLTDKEYREYLKSLPDDTEEGEPVQIDEDPSQEL